MFHHQVTCMFAQGVKYPHKPHAHNSIQHPGLPCTPVDKAITWRWNLAKQVRLCSNYSTTHSCCSMLPPCWQLGVACKLWKRYLALYTYKHTCLFVPNYVRASHCICNYHTRCNTGTLTAHHFCVDAVQREQHGSEQRPPPPFLFEERSAKPQEKKGSHRVA